jgi:hypothetical protein
MTEEEYEAQMRRLKADAEDARKAYVRAKQVFDGICEEMQTLRIAFREQREARDDRA